MAWVAINPNTSTVILGASGPEQVTENLKALAVIPKLTPAILETIEEILENKPEPVVCVAVRLFILWKSYADFMSMGLEYLWEANFGSVWTTVGWWLGFVWNFSCIKVDVQVE